MKRFWRTAAASPQGPDYAILLDGRPVRTPKGRPLLLPTRALAQAVAAEWQEVGAQVDPRAMPATGIANAAIDLVAPDVSRFAADLASYAASDLTCYRADHPPALVARQVAAWEPVLKALEERHGLLFRRTVGVVPVAQPPATLARVVALLEAMSPFSLAALQPIVSLSGSLVLALALRDGVLTAEDCFAAGALDADWQAEQWGVDAEAAAQRAARRHLFLEAARFLALAEG
ncbi:MAG: ATP12 family protein [Sphingomonadaceae bacterium]